MAYTQIQENGIKIVRFMVACDFRDLSIASKKWGTHMNIHVEASFRNDCAHAAWACNALHCFVHGGTLLSAHWGKVYRVRNHGRSNLHDHTFCILEILPVGCHSHDARLPVKKLKKSMHTAVRYAIEVWRGGHHPVHILS
jgi:hypothetical protein